MQKPCPETAATGFPKAPRGGPWHRIAKHCCGWGLLSYMFPWSLLGLEVPGSICSRMGKGFEDSEPTKVWMGSPRQMLSSWWKSGTDRKQASQVIFPPKCNFPRGDCQQELVQIRMTRGPGRGLSIWVTVALTALFRTCPLAALGFPVWPWPSCYSPPRHRLLGLLGVFTQGH